MAARAGLATIVCLRRASAHRLLGSGAHTMALMPLRPGSSPVLAIARTCALLATAVPLAAQATWTQRSPALAPSARVMHAMVYDVQAGAVLLFGGADGPGNLRYDDTWTFDGTNWTPRNLGGLRPAPRNGHGMTYDAARGRAVVFGGITGFSVALGDTWEWDGATWQARSPVHAPAARVGHAMAYDAARQRTVVFGGGLSGNPTYFDDTWEWDGVDWQLRQPAVAPPGSDAAVMAYDAARQRTVLFLPITVNTTLVGAQTWEWDGATWAQRTPVHMPSPRRLAAMTYDAVRQRIVLFGGHYDPTSTFLAETWEWDGVDWTLAATATHPSGRGQTALAYDALRGRAVLFGGALYWGNHEAGDTWEYGAASPATFTAFGAGCAGWAGMPWLTAGNSRPVLGQTLQVSLYNLPPDHATLVGLGWSNTSFQAAPLPLDLGVLGAPGCALHISPDLTWPVFNWAGYANWALPIPVQPSLVGMTFFQQAAAVDHSNAFGLVFTNAAAARIGDS
jgi:hypothetical protein